MHLNLREKQSFYHGLAQLVRSGIPFPAALTKLMRGGGGSVGQLLKSLNAQAAQGQTVAEAFAAQSGTVSPLEVSVIAAVEKSGRLEHGLHQLADYFGALNRARATILSKCAYPVFLLHFGVFMLALPTFFFSGARAYLNQTFGFLACVYGATLLLILFGWFLSKLAATNSAVDRLLSSLPGIGRLRRSFALARFCTVYELQLDAGVNVIDALLAAGRASRSARVNSALDLAIPQVRTGAQVGPLLAASGVFPAEVAQSFIVGEETGGLDHELKRVAAELQADALRTLETLADWLPKIIYVVIVLYLAWSIVTGYQTLLQRYMRGLEGE
ncbi:MAG: type II secretion system F family protein [Verrucomicrobiota bacterium]|nr:type II secretion system F family protein [Verrucomicrobiota bacterium]